MARKSHSARPEFSRPFSLAQVPEDGEPFRCEATPEERAALAKRFDLVDLPSLMVEGRITVSDHAHRARIEGVLKASVVQSCVVTLEPVAAEIDEPFVRAYSAFAPVSDEEAEEIVVSLDEDEPPEPLVGGTVDVGEAAAETLGLSLDPHPRALGARLEAGTAAGAEGEDKQPKKGRESPFSALKGLLNKR